MSVRTLALAALAGIITTGAHAQFLPYQSYQPIPQQQFATPFYAAPMPAPAQPFFTQPVPPPPSPMPVIVYPVRPMTGGFGR